MVRSRNADVVQVHSVGDLLKRRDTDKGIADKKGRERESVDILAVSSARLEVVQTGGNEGAEATEYINLARGSFATLFSLAENSELALLDAPGHRTEHVSKRAMIAAKVVPENLREMAEILQISGVTRLNALLILGGMQEMAGLNGINAGELNELVSQYWGAEEASTIEKRRTDVSGQFRLRQKFFERFASKDVSPLFKKEVTINQKRLVVTVECKDPGQGSTLTISRALKGRAEAPLTWKISPIGQVSSNNSASLYYDYVREFQGEVKIDNIYDLACAAIDMITV